MSTVFGMTLGKTVKLLTALQGGGLDEELADELIKREALTEKMVGWLRQQINPDPQQLFVSLETQLANVRRWNGIRGWGFTEADFDSVDLTPIEHSGLVVDVIAVYLPNQGKTSGIQWTFEELWFIASSHQPSGWRLPELKSDHKHLRLLDGIEHVPGIRRVTVDLGANWKLANGIISPMDVRNHYLAHVEALTHAEVLAAAAHFPKWVKAMDGEHIPYVWMPGYQVTPSRDENWRYVPGLGWSSDTHQISLNTNREYDRGWFWACPVLIES